MTDRYVVIGNPIAHSKSPMIHADFARQLDVDLQYCKLLSPLDGFEQTIRMLAAAGVKGANVTVPFKQEAYRLAQKPSAAVQFAQAANTLRFSAEGIEADNTDGIGLCTDLNRLMQLQSQRQGQQLKGSTVLMIGAGGAASGCVSALKDAGVDRLLILNRTVDKAVQLAEKAQSIGLKAQGLSLDSNLSNVSGLPSDSLIVVNASSSSLAGQVAPISEAWFKTACLAYDMMYGQEQTPFMRQAVQCNPSITVADGLGMLVFQAAAAFTFWTGLQPHAADTLERMRHTLQIKKEVGQ